jgi:hypothetical protein
MRATDTTITGVTFPVPKAYMHRFLLEGKRVFVKPATLYRQLRSGMRFVFYQSQQDTGFVGEATIKRIVLSDDPFSFYATWGEEVFLTPEELRAYQERLDRRRAAEEPAGETEARNRSWMALELEEIRAYGTVVQPDRFVPPGGRYIRGEV